MKKKVFALLMAATLMLTMLPASALAHGHGSGHKRTCSRTNCEATRVHKHGGKTYAGHSANDGHSWHGGNHH